MVNAEVGSAYVSIYPQTDGNFSKMVGKQLDKGASGLSTKVVALGNIMSNAITSAVRTAVSAVGDTISDAFWNYAAYEQLVGGVDKLFGEASSQVQAYAAVAYKTAGMSANQYMEQATGFSSALINSLGGDTKKAAELTDVAMRAMSDNVNVFGSNAEDVQNAIMGISRENYTMVDNLKLGYSGTKEGFSELIADANAYAESIGEVGDMSVGSFGDAIRAIQYIQEMKGISGTTAKEAASTLEGSLNQAKAAWDNFLTSFGTDAQTVQDRAAQLYDSLATLGQNVGAYATTAMTNAFDALLTALGVTDEQLAGIHDMFAQLGETMANNVYPYIDQAGQSFNALGETISPFTSQVGPAVLVVFKGLAELASALVGAVVLLASKFADAANTVIKTAGDMWNNAGAAIDSLNQAVADGWNDLKEWTADTWESIQRIPDEAMSAISGAVSSALGFVQGVFSRVWNAARSTVSNAVNGIRSAVGRVTSIVGTVRSAFDSAKQAIQNPMEAAKNLVKNAIEAIKGFFHFSVPTPSIPVPHFSISPPGWSVGDLLKGSIPSLSVHWAAKGGFVDGATLIGAGEKGAEMILPRKGALMDEFSDSVASKVAGGNNINVYLQYDASTDATQMAYEIARVLNRKLAMEA